MIIKKCNYCGKEITPKEQPYPNYILPEDDWSVSVVANIYGGSMSQHGLTQYHLHPGCYDKVKRIIDSLMSIKELK
jgi:hypothetical protein